MDFVFALDNHPVYGSLDRVFSLFSRKIGGKLTHFYHSPKTSSLIFSTGTWFFKKSYVKFSKKNAHILNSPLIALEAWEGLASGYPMFLVEEYYEKGGVKDHLASALLAPFKGYPFISQTKRTDRFLSTRGFNSTLIPPALEKRVLGKKRKHFLYVGKMIKSKNPMFVLKLAELMRRERFVMIGKGELLDQVRKRAEHLGNVEIVGWVKNREELFSKYYAGAKALVHPAFTDPIGFALIEALSCGTPVIASEKVGASDYLPMEWRVSGYDWDEWRSRLESIGTGSQKLAEEIFEKENLNINSTYFEAIGERLYVIAKEHGWF